MNSTQDFLQIQDITEDTLVLKDGSIRGILKVSAVNFALKSDDEQLAILHGFQDFLNSLDFSCQIIIQSRAINITPYLATITALEEKQVSELLRLQTSSYVDFIKDLVQEGNTMTKSFYAVIPYLLTEALGVAGAAKKRLNIFSMVGSKKQKSSFMSPDEFSKYKGQLWQRMEFVSLGLHHCGLDAKPLQTAEIIELFWSTNHPAEAEVGNHPEILPELLK